MTDPLRRELDRIVLDMMAAQALMPLVSVDADGNMKEMDGVVNWRGIVESVVVPLIARARAEEREEAARVADNVARDCHKKIENPYESAAYFVGARDAAAAIRARGRE